MRTASSDSRVGDDSRTLGAVLLALDPWAWEPLGGQLTYVWSLAALRAVPDVRQIAVVVPSTRRADMPALAASVASSPEVRVVAVDEPSPPLASILTEALTTFAPVPHVILLHDGTSPLVQPPTFQALAQAAAPGVLAIATEPLKDTVKVISSQRISGTIPREHLSIAFAPLAITRADLEGLSAPLASLTAAPIPTRLPSLALVATRASLRLAAVPGNGETLGVSSAEDAAVAAALLRTQPNLA